MDYSLLIKAYRKLRGLTPFTDTSFGHDQQALFGQSNANPHEKASATAKIWRMTGFALLHIKTYFAQRTAPGWLASAVAPISDRLNGFFRSFDRLDGSRGSVHYAASTRELRSALATVDEPTRAAIVGDFENYLGRNGKLLTVNAPEIVNHLDFVRFGTNIAMTLAIWRRLQFEIDPRPIILPPYNGHQGIVSGVSQLGLDKFAASQSLSEAKQFFGPAYRRGFDGVVEGAWNFAQTVVKVDARVADFNRTAGRERPMSSFFSVIDAADGRHDGLVTDRGLMALLDRGAPRLMGLEQLRLANFL